MAAIGFIIGVLIQTFAPSFAVLMFGRVFVGLGVGIGLAVRSWQSFEQPARILSYTHIVWRTLNA